MQIEKVENPKLAFLVRKFYREIEAQRERDSNILAGLVRALRSGNGDADELRQLLRSQSCS